MRLCARVAVLARGGQECAGACGEDLTAIPVRAIRATAEARIGPPRGRLARGCDAVAPGCRCAAASRLGQSSTCRMPCVDVQRAVLVWRAAAGLGVARTPPAATSRSFGLDCRPGRSARSEIARRSAGMPGCLRPGLRAAQLWARRSGKARRAATKSNAVFRMTRWWRRCRGGGGRRAGQSPKFEPPFKLSRGRRFEPAPPPRSVWSGGAAAVASVAPMFRSCLVCRA